MGRVYSKMYVCPVVGYFVVGLDGGRLVSVVNMPDGVVFAGVDGVCRESLSGCSGRNGDERSSFFPCCREVWAIVEEVVEGDDRRRKVVGYEWLGMRGEWADGECSK